MENIMFLANNLRKEEDDIIILIISELEISPNVIIVSTEYNPGYYSILPEEEIVYLYTKIKFNNELFKIKLHKNTYDERKNTLEINISYDEEYWDFSQNLYDFKLSLKELLKKYYKEIYINQDTQNEKICTQLYTTVHRVENLFRHIINLYMVNKFGVNWFKNNITEEYQSKVTKYSKWYRDNYTVFVDIQAALFNMQTDDLITMLKKSYIDTLSNSEMDAVEILKKKLGEARISLVVKDEYIQLRPIWESELNTLFDATFESDWETYTKMRNMIAHNKPICLKLRQDVLDMSERLEKNLLEKLGYINKKFTSIEEGYINDLYRDYEKEFYLNEAGLNKTPEIEEVKEEIMENEDYGKLESIIEKYIHDYDMGYDDIVSSLESIMDEKILSKRDINLFQERVSLLYKIFYDIGLLKDETKVEIIRNMRMNKKVRDILTEEAYALIDGLVKSGLKNDGFKMKDFQAGELARIHNFNNDTLSIRVKGDIAPVCGTSDKFDIDVYVNDNICEYAHGGIEKSYGNYAIHEEDGYAMPDWPDGLDVKLTVTTDFVQDFCKESIDTINCYYNKLEEVFFDN